MKTIEQLTNEAIKETLEKIELMVKAAIASGQTDTVLPCNWEDNPQITKELKEAGYKIFYGEYYQARIKWKSDKKSYSN